MDLLDPSSLPPGFGFHPTDVELISHYLKRKVLGIKNEMEVIPVVDIYKYEPWDLPEKSRIPSREGKWHFFNTRDRKYPNGFRSNRATEAGYWKSTGKDRVIRVQKRPIGTKKTLVFHHGRPPHGKRTEWIMHEYYLDDNEYKNTANAKNIYVLCRVTKRTVLPTASENGIDQVEKEDSPLSLDKICPEPLEEEFLLGENIVEPQTISSADFEEWLSELYQPDFLAISAPTNQGMQEVDVGFLAPKTEPVLLSPPTAAAPADQLPTGMIDYPNLDDIDWLLSFEGEISPVHHQLNLIKDQEALWGDGVLEYFDATNVLEACLNDPGTISNEMHGVIISDGFGSLPGVPDTGIQIRERRRDTFMEPNAHRIKLQVHKMEAPNNGPANETHVFVSDDHHLDEIEIGRDTVAFDGETNDVHYHKGPATPERNEHKAYRRTTQHRSQDNYQQTYATGYGPQNFPPRHHYEWRRSTATKTTRRPHFNRDSRLRDDVRKLVREARKEVSSIVHKYSSFARNCMFIGTCLMGGSALATFMQEAF